MEEINRIAENTKWNGLTVLDGDGLDDETTAAQSVTVQLGASASQTMSLSFKSWVPQGTVDVAGDQDGDAADNTNSGSAFGTAALYFGDDGVADTEARIDITDADNASNAITQLDNAITGATAERAKLGAYMSRLEYAADNLSNVATNLDQSRSRIQDADYAVETTELARTQIIAQASTAMLAQANQSKQSVLALLQ
jgi:flagellin